VLWHGREQERKTPPEEGRQLMTDAIVLTLVSGGLNVVILGAVFLNTRKVSKLEGTLNNGAFLKCPFYRKKVDNAASCDNGKATKNVRKTLPS
jgi:hypothetical protein